MGSIVEGQEACAQVMLVLSGCISDTPAVSLVFLGYDSASSPGYPPRRLVYGLLVSTLGAVSFFLVGNRKTELNPATFSSVLLVHVFI